MEFYRVYFTYADGQEICDVLTALSIKDAIMDTQEKIEESMDESYRNYGDEREDCIDEVTFWNEDLNEAFCSVTNEGITWYDWIPIATVKGDN